ncbi:unnamed protein product [Didymodactylos carnosus]|uniref:Amino acid permease n=1 Tax=Didymodactylos carnosus TaxID=1234261 RepID=A0A814ARS8_9BILA|nr:unnamed protein product [Didymodactylos carnosus]CAF3696408.1 unnamed protein product [Didymodactylos carnosus]
MSWKRLVFRKSVDQMVLETKENVFNRPLNFLHLNTLGLGAIIGAGIFVLSGEAAANVAGPSIIVSYCIAAVVAALAALSYCEMASMVPISGSSYSYVYTTMGEFAGWLVGWDLCLEYMMGVSVVAVGWSGYVASFIRLLFSTGIEHRILDAPLNWNDTTQSFYWNGSYFNLPAILIIIALTALLVYDIDVSATFNSIIVLLKIVIMLIFITACIKFINPKNYRPFIPKNLGGNKYGVIGMFHASTIVFFSFIGFDAITTAAQETKKESQNTLAISIMTSLMVSTVLYLGFISVLVGVVSYESLNVHNPISTVTRAMNMKWLEITVDVGAILGLTSVTLVNLFAQPRILYVMSKDGLLPKFFSKLRSTKQKKAKNLPTASDQTRVDVDESISNPPAVIRATSTKPQNAQPQTLGSPYAATIVTGVICALVAGFVPINFLAEITSVVTTLKGQETHTGETTAQPPRIVMDLTIVHATIR